ncbi:uncharacterized protein A1O9_06754 [Exophiala aquamarina CBS 119918]|uniref:RanBD1 domain-containing protein n=1 Tax=Exophiala aquamarina CBS 119918 TaxID=1182545 RepID=A0A072P9L1_9EURO|nr:uncharacterized protein A1O9_06754 [Exophiala aquamarina CBS 119918]KEF56566.1 hypothetical protein A1O9_06754 [Exophiala aquamarina CBS 119918]
MPKRVADEYITKDHGSIANPGSTQPQPTMPTAAQLAKRKIAPAKGRLGANRSSHSTFGANPSTTTQSGTQQTFGNVNGGITFGASQSFPPGITPQGGGFDFQVPQSSSFTFGAPSTGASNPFANLNGNASSDTGQDDISMESPQKKPGLGNTFGVSKTENDIRSGFTFGQQSQTRPQPNGGFSFGSNQSAPANTNGGGLFGRPTVPEEPAQSNNAFGQSPQPQSAFTGFGQAAPLPQKQASFTFGQTPSVPKSQEPAFSFGQAASVPKSQEPASSFGQNNNNTAGPSHGFGFTPVQNTNEQKQTPTFSFGQPAPQTQAPAFSFGQPASTTQNQSGNNTFGSPSPSTPFTFGQSQQPAAPPASNLFGGFSTAPVQETQTTASLFGNNIGNTQPAAEPTNVNAAPTPNPFAGLFGQNNNSSQNAPNSTPDFNPVAPAQPSQPTANPAAVTGPFKELADAPFGQNEVSDTSMNSNSLTSHTPSSGMSAIEYSGATSNPPSFANAPSAPQPPPSSHGLFSPTTSSDQPPLPVSNFFGKPSTTPTPAKSLFPFGNPTQTMTSEPTQEKLGKPEVTSRTPMAKAIFGANSDPEATPTQQASTKNLFVGGASSDAQNGQAKSKTQSQAPTSLFGTKSGLQSAPETTETSLFNAASNGQDMEATEDKNTDNPERVKRLVYTKAAPLIPSHLGAEQYREYDRNYRLHSLNVGLQNKLATLDPRSQDFDSVIRQYVASRESIDESLGLYVRNVAGMKRKGGQMEDQDVSNQQSKKQRSEDEPQASAIPTPATAVQAKQSTFPFAFANTDSSPSKATSVLKGMIPATTSAFGSASDATGTPNASNLFSGFTPSSAASKPVNVFTSLSSAAPSNTTNFDSNAKKSEGSSMAFAAASVNSTTPSKEAPKKPAFEVPKFGGANTNFMASFGTQAKASAAKLEKTLMAKRKAEDFDSDEDDEEQFNKKLQEENCAKKEKINSIAKAGFVPSFGATSSVTQGTKPIFSFGAAPAPPKETAQAAQPSIGSKTSTSTSNRFSAIEKANGWQSDSANDEDDDAGANGSGHDEDEDEGAGSSRQSEDGEEDDLQEDESPEGTGDRGDDDYQEQDEGSGSDDEYQDFQSAMARARRRDNASKGKSLFERIEPNPKRAKDTPVNGIESKATEDSASPILGSAKNSTFKPGVWGSNIGHSTPETPSFSPLTPSGSQSASAYKPSSTFNFTATPAATLTPTPGASIFAGGFTKGGPVPGEGMFGSRPSTPSNAEPPATANNLSKSVLASPAGTDNTWKQGNGISFGSTSNAAPTFKFTSSTPSAKDSSNTNSFGTLFGTSTADSASAEPGRLGFNFGAPSGTASPAPGFLGAVSHLGGGSVASSAVSSRATSPGLTDNESVATNETDDATDDPQTSLMDSRSGEENETCLWEGRSKALMFVNKEAAEGTKLKPNDWNSMGVGQVRVLQNKDTKKTRIVFRVEPSASILINSHLLESSDYESVPSAKSGAVRGTLFYKENLTRWVFKVKTPEMANAFAKALEDNKKA